MIESRALLGFDSTMLRPHERFDAYHALYSPGADVMCTGPDFAVTMRGWRLDRALLYDRHMVDIAHARGDNRAGRDGLDHFTLTLVIEGEYHSDTGTGFRRVVPGEILIADMLRSSRNRAERAHVVTLSIARKSVLSATDSDRILHGHVIAADRAFLLADHMASLARHAAMLTPASLMTIGRVTIDLLAVALTASAACEDFDPQRHHAERRDRVRAYIAERLDDPTLGPDTLVARFNLSRATLYRDFTPWGGLANYIRDHRLDRLREHLSSGDRRAIGELAIAVGLDHEGRASDAFRKRFGMRPGAYRRMVAGEGDLDGNLRRMREWTGGLR